MKGLILLSIIPIMIPCNACYLAFGKDRQGMRGNISLEQTSSQRWRTCEGTAQSLGSKHKT